MSRGTNQKGYCTYAYESVIGKGKIELLSEEEKLHALKLLMHHYHPDQDAYFNPDAIPRTMVYKQVVEEIAERKK